MHFEGKTCASSMACCHPTAETRLSVCRECLALGALHSNFFVLVHPLFSSQFINVYYHLPVAATWNSQRLLRKSSLDSGSQSSQQLNAVRPPPCTRSTS